METLDLNIDNYNYEDILNLFKINYDFGENELKNAKKMVLMMHPDKSGLEKQYFLFFHLNHKVLSLLILLLPTKILVQFFFFEH